MTASQITMLADAIKQPATWRVYDLHAGKPANRTLYATARRARAARDRLDLAYGACRYIVVRSDWDCLQGMTA
jgi:hypothetical protein